MSPPLSVEDWPIAASTLPFPGTSPAGAPQHEASAESWRAVLAEVAAAGFDDADVTDSWLRPGDLAPSRRGELRAVAADAGVRLASISAIRCSVLDRVHGEENLAYGHRTLDAAAELGIRTVSFGLHQALTAAQREQLWFWTVEGHRDDPADWDLAVARLGELGRHAAELGLLVSLEMYEDTLLGTGESAARLVEAIGLPNVGLNPDIGNLIRLHRPVERWQDLMAATAPYMNYWHVKNYARTEDRARDLYLSLPSPMEAGLIDYRSAMRTAIENGFQGVICTEQYGGDGLSISAANRDYLRRHVLPRTPDYSLGASRVEQLGGGTGAGA